MSTPSTITALHPQSHFYPHYSEYNSSNSSQRPSNLSLNRSSKLAPNAYSNAANSPTERQLPPLPTHRPPQSSSLTGDRQSSSTMSQSKSKKKADWEDFYKNGIPKEIIVIDDSSPEAQDEPPPPKRNNVQHDTKRRKTDAAYDSIPNVQHKPLKKDALYEEPHASSASSSGRNTALYSTAPTSLTSTSSAGHQVNRLDNSKVGQKRKRSSRAAQDEETPEVELVAQNQAWVNYVPPPKPPIKAGDVYTPVVRDVRSSFSVPLLRLLTRFTEGR